MLIYCETRDSADEIPDKSPMPAFVYEQPAHAACVVTLEPDTVVF